MSEERPFTTVYDASTGIQETRPMSDEEWDAYKIDIAQGQAQLAERQAAAEALATLKNSARTKLVAGQPLTEEEAAVLVI